MKLLKDELWDVPRQHGLALITEEVSEQIYWHVVQQFDRDIKKGEMK